MLVWHIYIYLYIYIYIYIYSCFVMIFDNKVYKSQYAQKLLINYLSNKQTIQHGKETL